MTCELIEEKLSGNTVYDVEHYLVVLALFILQINASTLFSVGAMALFFMRFLL